MLGLTGNAVHGRPALQRCSEAMCVHPTSAEMLVLQGPRWDPSAGALVRAVVELDSTPVLLGRLLSSHFRSLQGCAVPMRQETEAQGG